MTRRAARWMVVLVFAAIAGAATHQALTRSIAIDAARTRIDAVAAAAAQVDLALVEVAASQRGYVASGQGLDFWTGKVDASLAAAREALARMQSTLTESAAVAQTASAGSRLEDLALMDQRAREYVRDGRTSSASDLIFADGYEMIAAARTDAATAAATERAALAAPLARDRQIHLASIAALAGCAFIALTLLLRAPKTDEPQVTAIEPMPVVDAPIAHVSEVADDSIGAALDASLEGLDHFVPAAPAQAALPVMAAAPAPAAVNLSQAADVCVDLARLLDARDLQVVLSRIADVLEAEGVIVWMTDAEGLSLGPALTHGYAPSLMSRLGPLHVESDNATAAAWRWKATQVVDGDGQHPGALAVPMLTSGGCIGVLALELKDGRERASDVQSLARIVAAQLAASISPADAEARRAAEA